jgi:hypothetical protein
MKMSWVNGNKTLLGQSFRYLNAQGQRFQTPQQNQQNNTDYQDLNQQRRNTRMTTTATTQWLAVITSFASKQSFNK